VTPSVTRLPHIVEVTLDNYLRGDPDGLGGLDPLTDVEQTRRIRAVLAVIGRIRRDRLHRGTIHQAVKAIRTATTFEDAVEIAITELVLRGER